MHFGKGIPKFSQTVRIGLSELSVRSLVDMKRPHSSESTRKSCCVGHAVHAPYWDMHMPHMPTFFTSTYAHNIITTSIPSMNFAHFKVVCVQPQSATSYPILICIRLFPSASVCLSRVQHAIEKFQLRSRTRQWHLM